MFENRRTKQNFVTLGLLLFIVLGQVVLPGIDAAIRGSR